MTIKRNEDTNKCEDIPCSCIRGINVIISILPKVIYRLNVISFKIPITFFIEKGSKLHIEQPKIMNSKAMLRKKNKAESIIYTLFCSILNKAAMVKWA